MTTQLLKVLLVVDNADDSWVKRLRTIVSRVGTLDVVQKPDVFDKMRQSHYNIVIVDETQLVASDALTSQIRQFTPGVRVIVISETDDWHRARQAFYVGAADFILTSTSDEDLLEVLQEV